MVDNKEIARQMCEEAYSKGKTELLDQYCASNYVNHDPVAGDIDKEAEKRSIQLLRTAFPDLRIELLNAVEEGNLLATQWRATGTHQGDFMGTPASGREVRFEGVDLVRIENGKIVESWVFYDTLGFMQQLGIVPPLELEGLEELEKKEAGRPEARPS